MVRSSFDSGFELGMGIAGHQQFRYQTGPTGLMGGANASARIAVKVFIEEQVIPEMRVGLHTRVVTESRSAAIAICEEYLRQACRDFVRRVVQRDKLPGTGRTLDLELIAIIMMELLQGLDDQEVHGKPDRAPPVRVAAKQPTIRFRRLVCDRQIHAVMVINVGIAL